MQLSEVSKHNSSVTVSSIATFSVMYFVFRMLPTFPILGLSGGSFTLADLLPSLFGVLLGPVLGCGSILLGTLLAIAAGKPMIFFGLDFLPAVINALMIGLLVDGKRLEAVGVYVTLFLLFLAHPFTAVMIPIEIPYLGLDAEFFFAWMHLAALIILLSHLSGEATKQIQKQSARSLASAVFLFTMIGTMTQHLTGCLLYESIYGMFLGKAPESFRWIWHTVFWIYPAERVFIVIVSTLLGVPMLKIWRQVRMTEHVNRLNQLPRSKKE